MAKYRIKISVEAITFEELVQFGLDSGANIVNKMPWSFLYKGYPVTHENDDCYLIPTADGIQKFNRGDFLVTAVNGNIFPVGKLDFLEMYEPVE